MRVTIEHREEAIGVGGKLRAYFVDCDVDFSEEEKAIIRARGLFDHGFAAPAATPLPSIAAMYGAGSMRGGAPLLIVVGFLLLFFRSTEGLAGFLIFGGIFLGISGWLKGRRQDDRLDQSGQRITIGSLLANSRFTIHAANPAEAKAIDEELRSQLVGVKNLIQGSAALGAKQTFEL